MEICFYIVKCIFLFLISIIVMEAIQNIEFIRLVSTATVSIEELDNAFDDFVKSIASLCTGNEADSRMYFQLNYIRAILLKNRQRHAHCQEIIYAAIEYTESAIKWIAERLPYSNTTIEKTFSAVSSLETASWTGNAINLIELIYACHELKQFNDGEISLKSLTEYVGRVFGVDIKDASSYYARIRRRKDDERTYFIDRIKEVLLKKMERDDDKLYKRSK